MRKALVAAGAGRGPDDGPRGRSYPRLVTGLWEDHGQAGKREV